jgi:hypothetical protein
MRTWILSALACLVGASIAQAQVAVAPEYSTGQPVVVEVAWPEAPEGACAHVIWSVGNDAGSLPITERRVAIWPVYRAESYFLPIRATGFLTVANESGEQVLVPGSHTVYEATTRIIGLADVVPPGPGPGPGPGPVPPPDPVAPAPIPEPGFRCLIVVETSDLSRMPAGVLNAIHATAVRKYLNEKCVRGPDGKTPEWRYFDKDVSLQFESQTWKSAMAREKQLYTKDAQGRDVPQAWCVISNGATGFEGPVPSSPDDFLALLRKYGG